jgi:hypothetical protein
MGGSMRVDIRLITGMALEISSGQTAEFTRDNGKKAECMGRAFILTERAKGQKGSGMKENDKF